MSLKGLENMLLAKYEGVNYCGMPSDTETPMQQVTRMRDLVQNFRVREDDVFIVGFHRCGNHWLFEIVNMIINQTTGYAKYSLFESMIETIALNPTVFDDRHSPRLITAHSRISLLPKEAIEKRVKVLYTIRHPKDALVSMFKLFSEFSVPFFKFTGSWDDFFERQMDGEMPWGTIFDHFKDLDDFILKNPGHPVYIRSFERGIENPESQLNKICEFLGKPKDLLREIAVATQFDNMKKGTQEKFDAFNTGYVEEGKKGVMNEGLTGKWKKVFTDEQSQRFDEVFKEKLSGTRVLQLIKEECHMEL